MAVNAHVGTCEQRASFAQASDSVPQTSRAHLHGLAGVLCCGNQLNEIGYSNTSCLVTTVHVHRQACHVSGLLLSRSMAQQYGCRVRLQ